MIGANMHLSAGRVLGGDSSRGMHKEGWHVGIPSKRGKFATM